MTLPANVEQHSSLINASNRHSLHLTGYVVVNYAALIALANMVAGDLAYFPMNGFQTQWIYDGNITAWRILSSFYTTASILTSNTPISGVQNGDKAIAVDTGQVAFWNSITSTWNILT